MQDPRKHLPSGEYRVGERAEGPLRPDGRGRLGGDRGGEDQAVRFSGVLSGSGPGRPLHPHRPVLPDVGGEETWPLDPLHRAGRRDQHGDAPVRRGQGRRRPERPGPGREGQPDPPPGDGVQEGRGRRPRVSRPGIDGPPGEEGGPGGLSRSARPGASTDPPLPLAVPGPSRVVGRGPAILRLRDHRDRSLVVRLADGRGERGPGDRHEECDPRVSGPATIVRA